MKSIRKQTFLLGLTLTLVFGVAVALAQNGDPNYKPKRVNRAVELLADGQPIYYTGSHTGAPGGAGGAEASFEAGKKDAQTFADYISYDMEHSAYDIVGLTAYMKGLVAGGPTKSGHRTPAVIVNVPVDGWDGVTVRANGWMFYQVLATGAHGVMLTHADTPEAIEAMVMACRFPTSRGGTIEGRRGTHGSGPAAQIWGISTQEYEQRADPWPLNPNGELLLGVKEEDKYALSNVELNLRVAGVGMSEWGPGDMQLSLGIPSPARAGGGGGGAGRGAGRGAGGGAAGGGAARGAARGPAPPMDPRMVAARARVLAACKANHVAFLNSLSSADVVDMIKEGVMVGPASEETANIGRKFTNRQMPW